MCCRISGLPVPRKSVDRGNTLSARASSEFGARLGELGCRLSADGVRRGNGVVGPVAHTEQDVHLCPPTPKVPPA